MAKKTKLQNVKFDIITQLQAAQISAKTWGSINSMVLAIMNGAHEQHFVFINEDGNLKIIKESADRCHTPHSKELTEVFEIYTSKYNNQNDDLLHEYSKKLNMSVKELKRQIAELYQKTLLEHPEFFV